MKGLILNKGESYYSTFGRLFHEIEELSENYNWLISYPECYPQNLEFRDKLDQNFVWMTGKELRQMLNTEDFQWIWGVISGFDKNIELGNILKYPLPFADGYTGFWENPLTMQHKLAEIEIVAWDSSCSLYLSDNSEIIEKISSIYPRAEDLERYNKLFF